MAICLCSHACQAACQPWVANVNIQLRALVKALESYDMPCCLGTHAYPSSPLCCKQQAAQHGASQGLVSVRLHDQA